MFIFHKANDFINEFDSSQNVNFCNDISAPLVCVNDEGIATVWGMTVDYTCSNNQYQRFAKVSTALPFINETLNDLEATWYSMPEFNGPQCSLEEMENGVFLFQASDNSTGQLPNNFVCNEQFTCPAGEEVHFKLR